MGEGRGIYSVAMFQKGVYANRYGWYRLPFTLPYQSKLSLPRIFSGGRLPPGAPALPTLQETILNFKMTLLTGIHLVSHQMSF